MSGILRTLAHRQAYVARYVLPDDLEWAFAYRHPELDDPGPAIRGLRQWLRIDVTAPGRLAIPSVAVAELWRAFMRTDYYREFHDEAYGNRREADELTHNDEGLAFAYALATADEGTAHHSPGRPPALFRVDKECDFPGAQTWVVTCGRSPCGAESPVRCVQHRLGSLMPEGRDLPHQPVYRAVPEMRHDTWAPAEPVLSPQRSPSRSQPS